MCLMARLTAMKAKPGWWSPCLYLTVYFLCRGGQGGRSRSMWFCQSSLCTSRGTFCLHHAGLPSAAVLLFLTQKKTGILDVSCLLLSVLLLTAGGVMRSSRVYSCSLLVCLFWIVIIIRMDAANVAAHMVTVGTGGGGGELQVESSRCWSSTT